MLSLVVGVTFIVISVELRNLADLWIAVKTIFGGAVVVVTMDYCNLLCCCLLYTSPSPRDGATSRMPSSA